MDIRYSYRDAPTIKRFSESDAFMRGLMGPFGSGKSSGCVVEIVKRAYQQKPGKDGIRRSRWAVIRNTYKQLEDTSEKTFFDWLPPVHFGDWLPSKHNYTITKIPGCEIEVMFRALDRPDQVDNLLSLELTGAWVNEAREIPWTIIKALRGRVGRFPAEKDGGATWAGIFMDTNPPDNDSWWYKFFEESAGAQEIFKQPSGRSKDAENLRNLRKGYYDTIADGMDEEWVKVYVDGDYGFVIDGKPVYPSYKDSVHCRDIEPVPGVDIERGWDFGLTPACVLTQLVNGRLLILDEIIGDDMGADRFGDDVIEYCGQQYPDYSFNDTGDPAGDSRSQTDEKTCFQILRAKGIEIRSGEQTPSLRLESVRKPLNRLVDGEPGLLLSPRCKTLRKGFQGGYQFRRMMTAKEKYADKPDKNQYSHVHDALQYVAVKLFGGAVVNRSSEEIDYYDLYA